MFDRALCDIECSQREHNMSMIYSLALAGHACSVSKADSLVNKHWSKSAFKHRSPMSRMSKFTSPPDMTENSRNGFQTEFATQRMAKNSKRSWLRLDVLASNAMYRSLDVCNLYETRSASNYQVGLSCHKIVPEPGQNIGIWQLSWPQWIERTSAYHLLRSRSSSFRFIYLSI